jgi:hypothetical protein
MSSHSGPEISNDGLVFAYDMGNTQKSWKGAPTVNLITNPTNEVVATVSEFAVFQDLSPIFDANGTGTYSISADIKASIPGNITVYTASGSVEYNIGYYNAAAETFYKRFYFNNINVTRTDPAVNVSNLSFYGVYGTGVFPSIKNVQVEKNSFCTPFVTGTRSNTQALIDAIGNNTLTATSLTYANNNTFSFDGSYSYLQSTSNCGITGDVTLSAWIRPNRTGQTGPHSTIICTDVNYPYGAKLMNYKNNSRYGIWLGWAGGGNTNYEAFVGVNINDNTDKMLTASWTQSTGIAKIYLNGVLQSTQNTGITSAVALADGKITIGTDYNSIGSGTLNKYLGNIYQASIYNRTLTDAEVQQNFNATRSRYGI